MATENKKYLDLAGLQHLLNKLNEENRIIKHETGLSKDLGAYNIEVNANGHVVKTTPLLPSDIGAATPADIGNGKLTLKIGSKSVEFTANQTTGDNETFEITASDLSGLGLEGAMHFKGVVASLPTATTSDSYANGDVILVGNKEYVRSGKSSTAAGSWVELGDEGSHALKTQKIEGDGTYIINKGNGTLAGDNKLEHKLYNKAKDLGVYGVAIDAAGHVSNAALAKVNDNGNHSHTATTVIPADTYVGSVTGTKKYLKLKTNTAETTDKAIISVTPTQNKLDTTQIYGVGATTVSAVNVKSSTPVNYGTADCGTKITGIAKRDKEINYGDADYDPTATTVCTGFEKINDQAVNAYTASYADDCLTLTPLSFATKDIHGTIKSEKYTYGCTADQVEVLPAKAADTSRTLNSYEFDTVAVPVKNSAATTVAKGTISTSGTGGTVVTAVTSSDADFLTKGAAYGIEKATTGDVEVVESVSSTKVSAQTINVSVVEDGTHSHTLSTVSQ